MHLELLERLAQLGLVDLLVVIIVELVEDPSDVILRLLAREMELTQRLDELAELAHLQAPVATRVETAHHLVCARAARLNAEAIERQAQLTRVDRPIVVDVELSERALDIIGRTARRALEVEDVAHEAEELALVERAIAIRIVLVEDLADLHSRRVEAESPQARSQLADVDAVRVVAVVTQEEMRRLSHDLLPVLNVLHQLHKLLELDAHRTVGVVRREDVPHVIVRRIEPQLAQRGVQLVDIERAIVVAVMPVEELLGLDKQIAEACEIRDEGQKLWKVELLVAADIEFAHDPCHLRVADTQAQLAKQRLELLVIDVPAPVPVSSAERLGCPQRRLRTELSRSLRAERADTRLRLLPMVHRSQVAHQLAKGLEPNTVVVRLPALFNLSHKGSAQRHARRCVRHGLDQLILGDAAERLVAVEGKGAIDLGSDQVAKLLVACRDARLLRRK